MMAGKRRDREQFADWHKGAEVFHERAAEYDGWFTDSLVYKIELAAVKSLYTVWPLPQLEIGVGPGRFARDLGIALGLDPARAPLLLAQQRGIKCCQGIGEELPVKDGALDAVCLLFTLCFSRAPRKIMAECDRALRNKGLLYIGMIPAGSKWGRHLADKKRAGNVFYEHAAFYTIETVSRWLAGFNMSIVASRSTLYQAPEHVEYLESPLELLDERAGFAVIAARKENG